MNADIFLTYCAIGAVSELLSMKNPTKGGAAGAGLAILGGGVFLALAIPPFVNDYVILGLYIAGGGRVAGRWVGTVIDWIRNGLWLRKTGEGLETSMQMWEAR